MVVLVKRGELSISPLMVFAHVACRQERRVSTPPHKGAARATLQLACRHPGPSRTGSMGWFLRCACQYALCAACKSPAKLQQCKQGVTDEPLTLSPQAL